MGMIGAIHLPEANYDHPGPFPEHNNNIQQLLDGDPQAKFWFPNTVAFLDRRI
jgi:hypothetical protein